MNIKADAFKTIRLTNGATTATLEFELPDKSTVEVEMPIDRFSLGVAEVLRVAESAKQQKGTSAGGIQAISFSTAQTIEPHIDVLVGRMYLVIDRGMPHQIAYGLKVLDASKLGLAIYTEVEKWIASMQDPGPKQ